jgi:RNA polymerase sigma-70 factor (ECF subfamily)
MWPQALPEADLMIEKVKGGDIAAFEKLYGLYERSVYSLCLRLTGNILDAEDLTQEVFLQVHRKINTFRGEAAFGSWLYRIAINASMMYLRKRQNDAEFSLELLTDDVSPKQCLRQSRFKADSDPLERIALVRALSSLSTVRRNMIILHDIKGLTHAEVAEHLGVTANTSKSALSRAHRTLRQALLGAGGHSTMEMRPYSAEAKPFSLVFEASVDR